MTKEAAGVKPLAGQFGLVTGASRGVGRHIALALAAQGMHVVLAARDEVRLRGVLAGIEATGGSASLRVFDAADAAATAALVADVERAHGRLDFLVNNAGVNGDGTAFADCDVEAWWRVMEIDVRAPAILCRGALPGMVARGGGRIVNVSSGLGNFAMPKTSAYSVAKTALTRLTEAIATEIAGTGVAIFAISPGTVKTDMTREIAMFRDWTDWDPPEAAGDLCVAIASGVLDRLSGRFLGVREGIDQFVAEADRVAEQEMHVLRMQRLPFTRN